MDNYRRKYVVTEALWTITEENTSLQKHSKLLQKKICRYRSDIGNDRVEIISESIVYKKSRLVIGTRRDLMDLRMYYKPAICTDKSINLLE
jgi:hypothetical protein